MEKQRGQNREIPTYPQSYDCGEFIVEMFDIDSYKMNLTSILPQDRNTLILTNQYFNSEPLNGIRYVGLTIDVDTNSIKGQIDYSTPRRWRQGIDPDAPTSHAAYLRRILSRSLKERSALPIETDRRFYKIQIMPTSLNPINMTLHREGSTMSVRFESELPDNHLEGYEQLSLSALLLGSVADGIAEVHQGFKPMTSPARHIYIGIPKSLSEISDIELAIESFLTQWTADDVPNIKWGSDLESTTLIERGVDLPLDTVAEEVVSSVSKRHEKVISQSDILTALQKVQALRRQSPDENTRRG